VTGATVTFVDDEPNGLASMVGGLIAANLRHDPRRAELLKPAVIALVATDADTGITITLAPGSVAIANGAADGRADLRVTTDGRSLIELAATPLRLGLPDVFHPEGRMVARKVLKKRIRIDGLVRHPATLSRLARLLSVV
jgi:hypothetical protein